MSDHLPAGRKILQFLQLFFIFAWLTDLSALSSTDTYYSVYLLCAIAGVLCMVDNERQYNDLEQRENRILLVFAMLFATAVCLANYTLYTPLSVLQNLFDAVLTFFGGIVIGYHILLFLMRRIPLRLPPPRTRFVTVVFVTVFLSIVLIDSLYLFFALYPGVLTVDSFSTVRQALGLMPYDNIMPFWHTVSVEYFLELGLRYFSDINAAIALVHMVQIVFMALCMSCVVTTLYQIGVPLPVLGIVYFLYACMPYNIVYSVTLWKDIPFAGAAMLFTAGLYRLLKKIGKHSWLNYLIFIAGAFGFSLWRTNGWYAFFVVTIVMWFLLLRRRPGLVVIITAVMLICWVLINPVLDHLEVSETNFVEAFAIPMQQIARIIYEGRELTPEEYTLLSEIFDLTKISQVYDPLTVDPIKFETFDYSKVGYIVENAVAYLRLYLSLLVRYPVDFLKAWVDETKGYWNGGYFFWTYTLNLDINPLGIFQTRGENLIAKLYAAWFRYVEKPEILQFTISIGLHVWGLVTSFLINVLKKREEFLLSIPILVLIVGLWFGTPVYSEFRYAYPMILTMPLILCSMLYQYEDTCL